MNKVPVYNLEGKEADRIDLKTDLSLFSFNPSLVREVNIILQNNKRTAKAHTKTRGEVRGGGKKPWKQKGTGRARAGSNRSPIWRGGGVTFGPRNNRNYKKKINKKAAKLAFAISFKKKFDDGEIKIIDSWEGLKPKTKELAKVLAKMGIEKVTNLIVNDGTNLNLLRASRNLVGVQCIDLNSVNSLSFYLFKNILFSKTTFKELLKKITTEGKDKLKDEKGIAAKAKKANKKVEAPKK